MLVSYITRKGVDAFCFHHKSQTIEQARSFIFRCEFPSVFVLVNSLEVRTKTSSIFNNAYTDSFYSYKNEIILYFLITISVSIPIFIFFHKKYDMVKLKYFLYPLQFFNELFENCFVKVGSHSKYCS